jgi:hypothetical protein
MGSLQEQLLAAVATLNSPDTPQQERKQAEVRCIHNLFGLLCG